MPFQQLNNVPAVGRTTDAAITSDSAGTLSGKMRGIVKILADIWNSGAHHLAVSLNTGLSRQLDSIAATETTDKVITTDSSGNLVELTPQRFVITASASGATTLVAAVATKRIRILSMVLLANDFVNVKFQSHGTPTDLTGLLYLGSNGGFSAPYNPKGHFDTVSGEAFDINLSSAVAVGGWGMYIAVP